MLAISERAADAIRTMMEIHELPEGAGLRIETRTEDPEFPELTASVEPGPLEGDEIIDDQDVLVFLEPEAASYLDDKMLSADTDDTGQMSFVVHAR